jgi:hypothetical protein
LNPAPTEYHIFKDSYEYFELKHDIFMEDYLGDTIMGGDALNGTLLSETNLVHSKNQDALFCSGILNGIMYCDPSISVSNIDLFDSEIIFDIYHLNNYADIEDFYCLKTTIDFMIEGVTLYQIFEVNIKSLTMINDFWLTTHVDLAEW